VTIVQHLTEDDLKATVIGMAQSFGWRVAHFRPARTEKGWRTPVEADGKGWPDLVLVRDRVIYAELKSARGRVSPDQEAWMSALREAGAEVHLWRPSDMDEIERVLRYVR
jgi:hypothetical protein